MIPGLNRNDILMTKIYFPSIPEQTKIANFLTAVDEKIAQLTQKGDLLARYKKGVCNRFLANNCVLKTMMGGFS